MPVSAKFIADFTSFNQAVEKAELKLRTFQSGTAGVEKALSRMADSFTGRKLIQDATLAAEAIERIGGTSKLTRDELARVSSLASQASDKLRAMGQDVPPKIQQLAAATKNVNTETSALGRAFDLIGPKIAAAFSVGAVVAFAKEIGAFAGKMNDLSAETGIGVERLQALNYVAAGAGLTIENVTDGIAQLSKRVAGGDQSAVAALEKLNISVYELQRLSPDDAFVEIGEAVAGIENPMERTRIAMELFGKSGSRMLRIMTDDLGEMVEQAEKSGAVISKELIEKADAFDDAWTQAILRVKAGLVNLAGVVAAALSAAPKGSAPGAFANAKAGGGFDETALQKVNRELEEQLKLLRQIKAPGLSIASPEQVRATEAEIAALQTRTDWILKNIKATDEQRKKERELIAATNEASFALRKMASTASTTFMPAIRDSAEEIATLRTVIAGAGQETRTFNLMMEATARPVRIFNQHISQTIEPTDRFGDTLKSLSASFERLANISRGGFGGLAQFLGITVQSMDMARDSTEGLEDGFAELTHEGGSTSKGLSQIATSLTGMIAAMDQATRSTSRLQNTLGGAATGAAIGAAFGGVGAGVGAAIGALVGVMRKAGQSAQQVREEAILAAGGFDRLAKAARAAGIDIVKLLYGASVQSGQFQRNLEYILALLKEQEADTERLKSAMDRYGISIEQAGDAWRQAQLDEQAKELIEDWRVLVASGIDLTLVNEKMADAINEYLQLAIRTGTEVPAAMRPILQRLIEQGLLTDESGNAITDLEQAGVHFAETMTQGFDRVIAKLQELIDKLQEAGDTIGDLPSVPSAPGGGGGGNGAGGPSDAPSFARGTGGRYLNFGAGTWAKLHGHERVMTVGEGAAEAGNQSALISEVAALRMELRRSDQRWAAVLGPFIQGAA